MSTIPGKFSSSVIGSGTFTPDAKDLKDKKVARRFAKFCKIGAKRSLSAWNRPQNWVKLDTASGELFFLKKDLHLTTVPNDHRLSRSYQQKLVHERLSEGDLGGANPTKVVMTALSQIKEDMKNGMCLKGEDWKTEINK